MSGEENTMIDELAKAIDDVSIKWSRENHGLSKWDVPSDLIARAVLTRLMEPTPGMVKIGTDARWQSPIRDADNVREIWGAMLRAAMEE